MGLKRRNPARSRLLTAPEMLTIMAASPKPAANVQAPAPAKSAEIEKVEVAKVDEIAKVEVARDEIKKARTITSDERHRMIAKAAYRHAERAGFTTDPLQNWLLAEREIDAQLSRLAS